MLFTAQELNEVTKAVAQVLRFVNQTNSRMNLRERFFLSLGLRTAHAQEAAKRGEPERAQVHKLWIQKRLVLVPKPILERDKQFFQAGILATRFEEALASGENERAQQISLRLLKYAQNL